MQKIYKIRLIISGIIGILSILAFIGIFYPVRYMNVQLVALLQSILVDYSVFSLILILSVIAVTFIFGRVYCSLICPLGILQEFVSLIFNKKNNIHKNYPLKYFIAAVTFGTLIGGSTILIRYIDPYTIFGSLISLSISGVIAGLIVLAIVFFKNRFFCTNICPVGAVLGIISKISINKIYIDKEKCLSCGVCSDSCPSGCIDHKEKSVENVMCIKCFKCIDKCQKNAIKYGVKPKEESKFSIKRRDLLLSAICCVFLMGAIKSGIEISKNTVKKFKDIILPPGGIDGDNMFNKCLNCNLCVENCPNKILVKSDNNIGTVHIDYNKGRGFCKYDCNECSRICPSGAIKRISLAQKQNTKIASAVVNNNECIECYSCISVCPQKAISSKDGKIVIDASKCIGCGKCKSVCIHEAIKIFAIDKQSIITSYNC